MKNPANKRSIRASAVNALPTLQQQDGSDLMQALLAQDKGLRPVPIFGIVIGNVYAALPDGRLQLDIPALPMSSITARIACAPDGLTPGAAVAVMFEQGDVCRALVIGPMYSGASQTAASKTEPEVLVDRQRIVIEAGEELELRCGEAAIILTADGRILQRGTYISSDASATQRIRGGSVQIN
jgi:hypothetical protein